jgi:hypothetical protein
MITLIVVGLCLWGWGLYKTLTVYIAIIATAVSLALVEVLGACLSYLFWSETVRAYKIGSFMMSDFLERPGFQFWEAPVAPIIFFFDMVCKGFTFCWQCPNIFSIGLFAWWWYMVYQIWGVIVFRSMAPRYTPIR